jgi:hypothetical protein
VKFLNRLRRDRVVEVLVTHRQREAFLAEYERLWPGIDGQVLDARRVVSDYCGPLVCDIEDNYVCARHSNG